MPESLHFPRNTLTQTALTLLQSGLSSVLGLFAPQRMGKTTFLLQDVRPAAQALGWRVCYFSFQNQPATQRASALQQALAQFMADERPRLAKWLSHWQFRAAAGPLAVESKASSNALPSLPELCQQLAEDKKVTLLLLDDIDALAREPHASALLASLHSALAQPQGQLKLLVAGASLTGLLARGRLPVLPFAAQLDFPPLDEAFVRFMRQGFARLSGRELDEAALWQAFGALGLVPLHFRSVLETLLLHPAQTVAHACQQHWDWLVETGGYHRQWRNLPPLERAILQALAAGQQAWYAQSTRAQLAADCGEVQISSAQIQNALRRLQRRQLLGRYATGWGFIDPCLGRWVSHLAPDAT